MCCLRSKAQTRRGHSATVRGYGKHRACISVGHHEKWKLVKFLEEQSEQVFSAQGNREGKKVVQDDRSVLLVQKTGSSCLD